MADPKKTEPAPTAATKEPAKALELGPSVGELEEQNEELRNELALLKEQVALLLAASATTKKVEVKAVPQSGDTPVFDEDSPHGIVVGDSEVAFVQNGHQFGRDRRYLATEVHRGVARAFNPRLVGVVKPPRLKEAA